MSLETFFYWVNERHAMTLRQAISRGERLPSWADPMGCLTRTDLLPRVNRTSLFADTLTEDPILQEHKFTNVFRELDRVTMWIREKVREPFADHENLWFMLVMARMINWPPTLNELMESEGAWPNSEKFSCERLGDVLFERKRRGDQVEGNAYIISARAMVSSLAHAFEPRILEWWSKPRFIAQGVLARLWQDRSEISRFLEIPNRTLRASWKMLALNDEYFGFGPFQAWQTVLEWRYSRYLCDAPDRDNWAAAGLGAARGLHRLGGRKVVRHIDQAQALLEMKEILQNSRKNLEPWVPDLNLEAVQGSLCEYDKYMRVKLGQGRPRSRYRPFQGWPE